MKNLLGRKGRLKVASIFGWKGVATIIHVGPGKDPLLKVKKEDGFIVYCLRSEFSIIRHAPIDEGAIIFRTQFAPHMEGVRENG